MASKIEWTDETWNPIVGCSIVSPGCTNCYAMQMADRLDAMAPQANGVGNPHLLHYRGTTTRDPTGRGYGWSPPVWTGKVALAPDDILAEPLRWPRPRMIVVNSMGDLFHESVPDAWIDRVFAVMALTPQHTYQVLTKRSARMRDYIENRSAPDERGHPAEEIRVQITAWLATPSWRAKHPAQAAIVPRGKFCAAIAWPLPNVWIGVSAEDQRRADERVPDLLATPAAIRFVSAEPLLGPIEFRDIHDGVDSLRRRSGSRLDWVIVGGESGPRARPMHPDWARSIRDQCAAAGVPFFFKQWGGWYPMIDRDKDDPDWRADYSGHSLAGDRIVNLAGGMGFHGDRVHVMRRVGKHAAGRELDGCIHDAMPASRP